VAAVRPAVDGYRCAACNRPRERMPNTVVLGESIVPEARAAAQRGGAAGLRILGGMAVAAGILGAAVAAALVAGIPGIVLAAIVALAGVTTGALAMRAGAKTSISAERTIAAAREQAILSLAGKRKGIVTATEVARELRLSVADADAALTAMADGTRVVVQIGEEGTIHYVFRELGGVGPEDLPRVRVEAGEEADEAEEQAAVDAAGEGEAKARRERG
jgi:hypothetical protein